MMITDYTNLSICAVSAVEQQAAALFAAEIERRTGKAPTTAQTAEAPCVVFKQDASMENKDAFTITVTDGVLQINGQGIRALIYGYSLFLRKTEYRDSRITLVRAIEGEYTPEMTIRGHQLGYRVCNNTYDAWSLEDYNRYYLDMMMFGSNTVEHIPAGGDRYKRNDLMQYDADFLCIEACKLADALDLDVSLWYPNDDLPLEESVRIREEFFKKCPRLNVVFPPGGDPGEFPGSVFVERVRAISRALKAICPDAEMWPSAQAPHSQPTWGEDFIEEMEKLPTEIDGVITGPNRAFPIDILRRKLPKEYPIRLYPDITHNVRCEYPVHALRDDWHYAWASALSRESINPRPEEYRLIHRLTRQYIVGSVSYSEGVNDDLNKMVWADMDWSGDVELQETLLDYARAFIWQAPAEKIADGIYGLERNWEGDPAENPHIESTLSVFAQLAEATPALLENWRFCQLYFRACCDTLVCRRRKFELDLLRRAKDFLRRTDIENAVKVLQTAYPASYTVLRGTIDDLAERLYKLIGMQLDVAHYGASAWDRGATLETIDQPVTDRAFYLNRLEYAQALPENERKSFIDGLLNRNKVRKDEYYFSFAEHGFDVLGEPQTADFYMDFQGDSPRTNDGSIPMCQLKLFDHFNFRCKLAGMIPGQDYKLRVSYSSSRTPSVTEHKVSLDGKTIYCGPQYGGERDEAFDKAYLAPDTETATYLLPAEYFQNGCAELIIEEPTVGMMLSEFWVLRA